MALRRLVAAATCASALLAAAPAGAAVTLPVGLVDTKSSFPNWSAPGFYNLDTTVRVLDDGNPGSGIFWAQTFFFEQGDVGYMGLQTQGRLTDNTLRATVAIFSVFDNQAGIEHGVSESHPNCEREDTDNPDGDYVKCAIAYPWVIGRAYRLRLWEICCGDQPNAPELWGAWVRDETTGVETPIGEIRVPGGWQWLERDVSAFVEFFGPSLSHCSNLTYTKARWSQPTADGGDYTATRDGIVGGYGPCVDFARGYTLAGRDYAETGIADVGRDAVRLTIEHYYHAGLGRAPDTPGLEHQVLAVGPTSDATCRENLRTVARNMHGGTEYQTRWTAIGPRVDHLYQSVMHRRPDSGGRTTWINRYSALGGNWPALVGEFVNSAEATQRFSSICTYRF